MNAMKINSVIRGLLASVLGKSHAGKRDLYQQFGYPLELIPEDFWAMYLRNDIANRIIRAFPQATWRRDPIIRDDAGDSPVRTSKTFSPFVESVDALFKKHGIIRRLERADRLASIGKFGVLVLGFQDGQPLSKPLTGKPRLIYLTGYGEPHVSVQEWVRDEKSPRFGKPLVYSIRTAATSTDKAAMSKSMTVHYSRVIHMAEYLDQDDTFGVPRLMPVFNRLKDLEKLAGASVETFWLNSRGAFGLFADADADLSEEMLKNMKDQAEEFEHQLRRTLAMQGVTATQFQAAIADPKPNADMLLDLIAGAVGMPKRILIGSERGELSSAQDENNWSDRVTERRQTYAIPSILHPLMSVLIETGNVAPPQGAWWAEWPANSSMSPTQEAELAEKRINVLRGYLTPGAELVIPPNEFRTKFLGLEPQSDEADNRDPGEDNLEEQDPLVEEEANELRDNAEPRTLYVSRRVVNTDDILDWASEQGLSDFMVPLEELHVTIAYSRSKVDWMKIRESWSIDEREGQLVIPPGGPRVIEQLGDKGAVVLSFVSNSLTWRHQEIREAGAGWDWASYQPHVTLSYTFTGNVRKVKAYQGRIVLGPEIFEEVDSDWRSRLNFDQITVMRATKKALTTRRRK